MLGKPIGGTPFTALTGSSLYSKNIDFYTQQQLSNQAYLARALQTNLPPQANDSGVDNTAIKREVKSANRAWLAKYNNEILELGKQAINV